MADDSNAYKSPAPEETLDALTVDEQDRSRVTNRQTYNIISDTVAGVNVRLKDNLFQAAAMAVCMALGAAIGASFATERLPGAFAGGFAGLVVGLLGSGIFLMIFRAVRHISGRHD